MSDQKLWQVCIAGGIDVRAEIHPLHAAQDSGALYGAELQIPMADSMVLRELFVDERQLHLRSMQFFERIVEIFQPAADT
jgi:hypothetical protein